VIVPAIATGLTALVPALGQTPFVLFFLAVIVSAAYGGQGPSLLATVVSAAAVDYFFLSPHHSLVMGEDEIVRVGLFAIVGLVTGSLTAGRRRVERERAGTERSLQAILDHSTAVVYVKDLTFRYLLVNRRYETLFHVTREQVMGKTSHDVFAREMADRFRANDEQAMREGAPIEFEEVVPQDDGLHTYISLKFPLLDATGRPYAFCGISTDITDRKRAAQLVAERGEWLRVTLSSIGDAVIATDTHGRVTFINPVAERLTGWTAAEAAGRPLESVFPIVNEETRAPVESPVAKVLRDGQIATLSDHAVLLARDGREIPIDDSGAPIQAEDGALLGVVLVFHEITERRRLDRDRERQRREADVIADVAASITASLDVDTVLERVAGAARELCTADAARIALREADGDGMVFRHSVGEGLAATDTVRLVTGKGFAGLVMDTGRPLRTDNVADDPRTHPDYRWLAHADGTTAAMVVPIRIGESVEGLIYLTNRVRRPFTDSDEAICVRLAGYAAIALANSRLFAREQVARAEAETAERRATFLAEASRVLGGSLDYERTLQSVARLAVPFLADWCAVDVVDAERGGSSRVAVTHRDPVLEPMVAELMRRYPIDLDNPAHPIARVLRTGQAQLMSDVSPATVAGMARDGEHLVMLRTLGLRSYVSVPLQARGQTFGALSFAFGASGRRYGPAELAVAEDLGRRAALAVDNARLYREAESVNRAKDEFLATLSHELRTPLHAMLGWARMLRGGNLEADAVARGLDAIERNTRLQAQLIEDLLDVSRIITGKLRLDSRPVDLAVPVDAAIEALRPAAEAKSIAVQARIDPEAGTVLGDPARLQQVVWNLVSNAIKFTPRGGRVTVSVERGSSTVRLGVTDTGKGISADFLPYIFDRFRQADSAVTRAQGGLGLGLAIVRHLVEAHGGTVTASSEGEGRGATFTVSLPALAAHGVTRANGDVTVPAESSGLDLAPLDGVRVLLVDDEPDARDLVGTLLRRCGADVITAASTREALEAVEHWRPDLIVSDIGLPGEDGYALVRKLRGLGPERGGDTPALALTAYARDTDARNARAAGYQAHLAKPVDLTVLASAVAELARMRKAS
jgi:PAS domain S-box-containing protein